MSRPSPIPIDDAAIRHAARTAWGRECASPRLRQRTMMAITHAVLLHPENPSTTPAPRIVPRWRSSLPLAAASAAVLLLSIGLTWLLMGLQNRPTLTVPPRAFVAPPAVPSLYALLVARHDAFHPGFDRPAPADASPTSPSLPTLRSRLANQVRQSLWAPDLPPLGWKLTGAGVYPVGGVSAVAFHFQRGTDRISAFSIPLAPSADICAGPRPDLDLLLENRSFAAFSDHASLFALVGSRGAAPYPPAELRALLDRFRSDPACHVGCPLSPL